MLKDYPIRQLIPPLLAWYPSHARALPWREDASPYRVWVSEIMLQQTRVEAVKPYFERFVNALPDVAALAQCPQERLLKLWEGLGYYNRVRNMQEAARTVMEEYGGELPADYEALLKLKGIGSYTAGAIASIAYGIPVPAVDGNVLRILMRVSEDGSDIRKQSVKAEAERLLLQAIPKDGAAMLTQAMMELGATVCVPNGEPKCGECPWQPFCLAFRHHSFYELPYKSRQKPRRIEQRTVLVIRDGEKVLLHRRPKKGLLAGLYEFPNLDGYLTREEAVQYVEGMGLLPLKIEPLENAKHIFSHVEWQMAGYMVRVAQLDGPVLQNAGYVFADAHVSEEKYAIPSAFARYTKYMDIHLGIRKNEI